MSLMQTVFGGSKGGGSFVDQTQQPFLKDVYTQAQNTYGNSTGQDYANQFLQPSYNGFNSLMSGGYQMPGLTDKLNNFGTMQNEALDSAVASGLDSMSQNFSRNIMPAISTGSAMSGTSGGSRQGIAEGLAANDFNKEASNFANSMYSNNWSDMMNNNFNSYGLMNDMQNQQNTNTTNAVNLAPTTSGMGFNNQWNDLNQYGQLVGNPNNMTKGTTTNNAMFSGENAGMAGMMTMLSDRRLKDNIVRIGSTDGGTPLYRFNYKWSPDMVIGVMADEVDDAITVDVGGYKAVDYSRVK